MKRLNILVMLVMTFGFSLSAFAVQDTIVVKTVQNRKALLEEYTGIHCPNCPLGHALSDSIAHENPGNYFAMNIHPTAAPYTTPYPGTNNLDFRTPDGDVIAEYFGVNGLPTGGVNRHYHTPTPTNPNPYIIGRSAWRGAVAAVIAQPSYVNLGAKANINIATRELTVEVQGYFTGTGAPSKMLLSVALTQDSTIGEQANGYLNPPMYISSTQYIHMHALRDMISPVWGDTIAVTAKDSFFSKTYTYQIPTVIGNIPLQLNHLNVLTFISSTQAEIETANKAIMKLDTPAGTQFIDLGLISATNNKPATMCDTTFSPTLNIWNYSTIDLDTVNLLVSINGKITQLSIPQQILAGQSANVLVPTISIPANSKYTVVKYTISPKGYVDPDESNNYLEIADEFYTLPTNPIGTRYSEDFETYMNLSDPIRNVIEEKGTPGDGTMSKANFYTPLTTDPNVGGYAASRRSYRVEFSGQQPNNPFSYTIKTLSLTKPTDNEYIMRFDYAYAQQNANTVDTMAVFVSTDCAATWTKVWEKYGADLATAPAFTTGQFKPDTTQWQTADIGLSQYMYNPAVLVKIVAKKGQYGGKDLYFDNIEIRGGVGIEDKSITMTNVKVFPNPTKDILNIEFKQLKNSELKINIFNNLGQNVYTSRLASVTGKNNTTINTSSFTKGFYTLQIVDKNNTFVTKKIIIQ